MKLVLRPGPDATFTPVMGTDGSLTGVEVHPRFPSAKAVVTPIVGESRAADGRLLDGFALSVSGVTGRVGRRGDQAVAPAVDAVAAGPAPASPAGPAE